MPDEGEQSELIGKTVWAKVKDDDDLWVLGTGAQPLHPLLRG